MTQNKTPLYLFLTLILVVLLMGAMAGGVAIGYFWGLADGTGILEEFDELSEELDYDEYDEDEYAESEYNDDYLEETEERLGVSDLVPEPYEDERETDPYILGTIKKPHPNSIVLPSGVAILNLGEPMAGTPPDANDHVVVELEGWTTDGQYVDDYIDVDFWDRPVPVTMFVPGLAEALQHVRPNEFVRVWVPEKLAYKGKVGKPKGMLVYDVELFEIKRR